MTRKSNLRGRTSITNEEINELPLKAFEGDIVLIDKASQIRKACHEIEQFSEVGFDTETRPTFKRGQRHDVALMQIAIPEKVFLIRLNHTGLTNDLVSLLEADDILKAGVALRDDIKGLQRLKHYQPAGFVELATLAKEAGLEVESVKKLTALLLDFRISKSAQTSNWEADVLNEKQLKYAATDAWVCLHIYQSLL